MFMATGSSAYYAGARSYVGTARRSREGNGDFYELWLNKGGH
jgi:hypothetical protein